MSRSEGPQEGSDAVPRLRRAQRRPPAAPAVEAPGSDAPIVEAPSSDAPTVEAPGSDAPIVEARGSDAPSSEAPTVEAPSSDAPTVEAPGSGVDAAPTTSVLPGAHRGGFARLPTAPVDIAEEVPTTPDAQDGWRMVEPPRPYRGVAGWALGFSIVGLIASLFVGWGFPVGLVGVIAAIVALRRPIESRAVAVWALALGALSVLYSAGWLAWAVIQLQQGV